MTEHTHQWSGAGAVQGKGFDDAVYISAVCVCGAVRLYRLTTGRTLSTGKPDAHWVNEWPVPE